MLASALALALFFAYSMLDIAIVDDKRGQDCYRKHKECKLSDQFLSLRKPLISYCNRVGGMHHHILSSTAVLQLVIDAGSMEKRVL